MNLTTFALVLTGVLLNAAAQLLLKAGTNTFGAIGLDRTQLIVSGFRIATEPHVLAGLTCYVFSVAIWIAALSKVSVSIAYPMLSIGYVVNALAAWYLFGEPLTVSKLAGIAVIIVGVVLVARG
jgi:multidrug transporter EmrE-like cation transporter